MIKRPMPKQRRSKHLCADAGYRGKNTMKIVLAHGYIPRVVGRKSEAECKKRDPRKKAQRSTASMRLSAHAAQRSQRQTKPQRPRQLANGRQRRIAFTARDLVQRLTGNAGFAR